MPKPLELFAFEVGLIDLGVPTDDFYFDRLQAAVDRVKDLTPSFDEIERALERAAAEKTAWWKATGAAEVIGAEIERRKFLDDGGCPTCFGYTEVLKWSTLDGPGWDEFESCPSCSPHGSGWTTDSGVATLVPDPMPGSFPPGSSVNKYRRPFSPAVEALVLPVHAHYNAASRILELYDVKQGSLAKVVRGRKVPVGTQGRIVWRGAGAYGTRVGIKDAAGVAHWTALENVEAIVTPEQIQAAIAVDPYFTEVTWASPPCQMTAPKVAEGSHGRS